MVHSRSPGKLEKDQTMLHKSVRSIQSEEHAANKKEESGTQIKREQEDRGTSAF